MARIISRHLDDPVPTTRGPESLVVDGRRFANTAAKFWASLIDEIREDTPQCTCVELTALTANPLCEKHLFPETALQEGLADLLTGNIRQFMRDAIAELEVVGPPASVTVRLLADDEELLSRELPPECIDADIFPCLLVWPLEWAGIPRSMWNNEFLSGALTAEDRRRGLVYRLSFSLTSSHLSEGLYRRCIRVTPSVSHVSLRPADASPGRRRP
jgi:hypothetical protein